MNRKGQFFLIAALIISGIIITLGAINISTKTTSNDNSAFYDLSREIDFESNKLIDYGIYQKQQSSKINTDLTSLISNYSAANPDTEMLFIYGDSEGGLTILQYNQTSSGNIALGSANRLQQRIISQIPPHNYNRASRTVMVNFDRSSNLTFDLNEGESFFIVLKKKAGEETLVAQQ